MTLIYARDINLGETNNDGEYIIVQKDSTLCEPCIIKNRWGYTALVTDVPGEKCELCGFAD